MSSKSSPVNKVKAQSGSFSSPAKQLKQASLFSFFSKSPTNAKKTSTTKKTSSTDSITPNSSSPLRHESSFLNKSNENKENKTPIYNSRKADLTADTSVGLSQAQSQTQTPPKSTKKHKPARRSAALISNETSEPVEDLANTFDEEEDIEKAFDAAANNLPSSPIKAHQGRPRKINYSELSDEDDDDDVGNNSTISRRKKRKTAIVSDDDDDDFKLVEQSDKDDDAMEDDDFVVPDDFEDDNMIIDEDLDDDVIPLSELGKKKSKKPAPKKKPTPDIPENDISKSSFSKSKGKLSERFAAGSKAPPVTASKPYQSPSTTKSVSAQKKFTKENEERYQWLVNVRDAQGHAETDSEYDSRTLYIPANAWTKFTAFEKQYWEIKSKMWDSVVFFKKGKFYELYEKDADIAHQKFDLKLAGGGRANMRLAGIPEMSFDYWAKRFIDEGYKVAKVDQKESMLAKEIREKGKAKGTKKEEKVIRRELSCVLTAGTLTDENMLTDEMSKYCLAVKEITNTDGSKIFGVCFVDTATGKVQLTQFEDDPECNKLETLLAQVKPMEILVEKSKISSLAMKLIRFNAHQGAIFNFLKSGEEFWDHEVTFEQLTRGKYFEAEDLDDLSKYPKILVNYHEKNKTVGFSAFGALLWYLKSLKLDTSIISMGNFDHYDPFKSGFSNSTMRLDGVTLQNLEIFSNSFDQSEKGTLFKLLNRAITAFGKRAFRNWVVHPLLSQDKIESRLDAVESLMNDSDLKSLLESKLSKLPDLERLLAKVHSGTLRVKDFTKVIEGFENMLSLIGSLEAAYGFALEGQLGTIIQNFPSELKQCVDKWSNAFDRSLAIRDEILVPEKGVEPEFDESDEKVKTLEKELDDILRQYRREYKCQEMVYKDNGKEIYQIEVPIKAVSRIPKDWQQMAATAKCKRYWSPQVKRVVRELMEARELHKILSESLQQKMYARFDSDYPTWSASVRSIAEIDCLISLVRSSESLGSPMCRPEFIKSDRAELNFEELRHPCFLPGGVSGAKDFIPNDVVLGSNNEGQIGLLTGANAAGKSTLLRMTCIAVLMAQIGCFVPASSAKLTPIDSIMTRLGANDNIMQGKSTFFVELSETKRMLEAATPKSLIVLDELGRGGSSSDGFAIAEAVLHHVATHIQSIGFFATHYGTLGQSFTSHPRIKALRMGILVDEQSKNITFLYRLEPGKSNGSFGMHVAAMCGVQKEVVNNAEVAAQKWEHTSKLKKAAAQDENMIPLGLQSDISWLLQDKKIEECCAVYNESMKKNALSTIFSMIEQM